MSKSMRLKNSEFIDRIRQVIAELIAGDYATMEREGILRKNTAEGTAEIIARHPGKLTMPPAESFCDVVAMWETEVQTDEKQAFIVVINLWFSGKESDLVLEARCTEKSDSQFIVTVHDIL